MSQGFLFTLPDTNLIMEDYILDNGNGPKSSAQSKNNAKKGRRSFSALVNWKWAITAFLSSLSISIILSLLSTEGLNYLNIFLSCLVLVFFVAIGVFFDIIGLAVATADEKPFLAMAARKVRGGKTAVRLVKNADRVSSFCNDVIGDIAGVVSGATAAALAIKIALTPQDNFILNLLLCGLVSAFTVGAKAVGKAAGMNYSNEIVMAVARFLSLFRKDEKGTKDAKKNKAADEE